MNDAGEADRQVAVYSKQSSRFADCSILCCAYRCWTPMTENNESNGNPPTAFSPRAATSVPHSSPRYLSLSLSLSLSFSPGRSSAHCARTIGGSLYLPPCSFSSILALLHWLLYLPFHCPLFHYFRRIPVSLVARQGVRISPPFIYGAVITDVLTEFKRHKWPAMISLVYEMLASPLPLPLLLLLLCCLSAPSFVTQGVATKLVRQRAISRTRDLSFRHQRKYFVI